MRVLVTTRSRDEERGAIAPLAGILAIVLFGISAFTVDLGMAYASKRQLQTLADSAALAAAAEYAKVPGDCNALINSPDAGPRAETAAERMRDENEESFQSALLGTLEDPDADLCSSSGEFEITYTAQATTSGFFGGILGGGDITTTRSASASVTVPDEVTGLRPYIICSDLTPEPGGGLVRVDFPDNEALDTNCPSPSGNWFTLDCPHLGEKGPNGNPGLADNTRYGCDKPVRVVESQDESSPEALSTSLKAACDPLADYDEDCLTANPGNDMGSNGVDTAWSSLIGKDVVLPVFCGKPTCDPVGVVGLPEPKEKGPKDEEDKDKTSGGDNAKYPVYRFVGVKVCGYHWGPKSSGTYDSHSNVAPVPADDPCRNADASLGASNENYLLLAFTHVVTSGSTAPSSCRLGDDTCDTGARRVLLTR